MSSDQAHEAVRSLEGRSSTRAVLRGPVTLLVAVTVLVTVHVGLGHKDFSLEARLGAALMGIIAFVAVRGASTARMPFLPYLAAFFYFVYGTSTLSEQRLHATYGPVFVSDHARSTAVWACTVALGTMVAVGSVSRPIGHHLGGWLRRILPQAGIRSLRGATRAWALIALFLQAALLFQPVGVSAWGFALAIVAMPAFVQALLFSEWQASRAATSRMWFWGYTLGSSALGLVSGAMHGLVVPFVGAFILLWLGRKRFRLAPLVLVAGVALALNPAKHEFRQRVWFSGQSVTVSERVEIWGSVLQNTWGGERADVGGNLQQTRDRFSEIMFVAQVFDWVPHFVPHAGFHRWKMIAYSYIPRAIWPEKPEMTRYFNSDYAITFGLQTEQGTQTAVLNLPLVTEAYWTAGWLGIVLASAFVGLLVGAYEGAFSPAHWGMHALGMTFLLALPANGQLATFYMGIAQRLAVSVGTLWLIAGLSWLLSANRRA